MKCCSLCGQEIPERREGVRLSPLKTRLFDAIKRAGRDGIAGDDLFDLFLRERGANYTVLKTHVCQINEKLAGTDCMIAVTRMGGSHGIYRLKKAEAAE
jgi:hypothetical protein